MTIEIKKPELEALIQERLESGAFQDLDELLTKAIGALPAVGPSVRKPKKNFARFLMESPLPGSGLELRRQKDYPSPIEL